MTQLTSFDLQAFLFLGFHRTLVARIGHALFMTAVNPFLLVHTSSGVVHGALAYTIVMLLWYGAVAWQAKLRRRGNRRWISSEQGAGHFSLRHSRGIASRTTRSNSHSLRRRAAFANRAR